MNQQPNFPNQDSADPQISTAEMKPGVEAMNETASPSASAAKERNGEVAEGHPDAHSGRLSLPPIRQGLSYEERCQEAMELAQDAFSKTGSWVVFYREVLGENGLVRKLFVTTETVTVDDVTTERTNTEGLRKFEATPHFGTLLEMAAALRSEDTGKGDEFEPQKMITVRLPRSQHETLKTEAEEHETSINKLCISKLLLPIAKRFIPTEKGKVRGRKPGPQGSRKPRLSEAEKTP